MFGFSQRKVNGMSPESAFEKGQSMKKREKAFPYYKRAAEGGHIEAQYKLAEFYAAGHGCERSHGTALRWYEKAANAGHAAAAKQCGYLYSKRCHFSSDEYEPDEAKSLFWYEKAAELGDTGAMLTCAKRYDLGNGDKSNLEKALYWYECAAECGDTAAMIRCGKLYLIRFSVENSRKSHYWYEKAAELGNAEAQLACGNNYWTGLGCTQDRQKALNWYEQSAQYGKCTAMQKCAEAYESGEGCEKDLGKARYWYEKLKENATNLEKRYCDDNYPALGAQYRRDRELVDKALARLSGVPVKPPIPQVKQSTTSAPQDEKATEPKSEPRIVKGDTIQQAVCDLSEKTYRMSEAKKEPKNSLRQHEQAAKRGNAIEQKICGDIYYYGDGCNIDDEKALYWYLKAARQGSAAAQFNCGWMYYNGIGTERNKEKALYWYREAGKQGYIYISHSIEGLESLR